jgi:hypothetical protein
MSFKDLALPMAMDGVPVIRLQPRSKIPMDKAWQNLATTDVDKILAWDKETPNANCGCVAKPDGVLFFETDEPGVIEQYEKDTGDKFKTFTVQSRKDRYHFYFGQTDETRACGSITQKEIPFGSLRQANAYVVAPGSIHPTTGLPYAICDSSAIIPAPSSLIKWIKSQINKGQSQAPPNSTNATLIPHGGIHAAAVSEAGRLRKFGYDTSTIETTLLSWVHKNCAPPIDDSKIIQIAKSMANYAADDPRLNNLTRAFTNPDIDLIPAGAETEENPVIVNALQYPYWCWDGTLYEDFAMLCGENNVVPKEYFIESIKTVVGAICGHRILPYKSPSQESRFYTVLIGPGGCGKSSASKWARDLFIGTGLVYGLGQSGAFMNIGTAQGSFGSSSGMIKNGFSKNDRILQVYDEATSMVEKFGIIGSGDSFLDAVNAIFESGYMPELITKESKDKPIDRPVHNSIIGCSTKEKWASAFSKTSAESSGFFQRLNVITSESSARVANWIEPDLSALRDRFVRKIQPLEFQYVTVNKTAEAIDMLEKWYSEQRDIWRNTLTDDITGRIQVLIHRNASHLAWLMSGDDVVPNAELASEPIYVECDEDIMRRAIALAEYEIAARQMHQPAPGKNDWAVMEGLIKKAVKIRGTVQRNKLFREVRADHYGIQTFDKSINNLVQEGVVRVGVKEGETKRGRRAQFVTWCDE